MPLPNVTSGFDVEIELSPTSLQQFISQLWELGLVEQSFPLDPGDLRSRVTVLLDPEAERRYSAHPDWVQRPLTNRQEDPFRVEFYRDPELPHTVVGQLRLLLYVFTPDLEWDMSVEAILHLADDIDLTLLHLQAESLRNAQADWLAQPFEDRGPAPTLGWDRYMRIQTVQQTDLSLMSVPNLVNTIGFNVERSRCNRIEDDDERSACLEEVQNRPPTFYFDELLGSLHNSIYAALDETVLDENAGLGRFLQDQLDELTLWQLGRIGLNALPNGALGVYINSRQKTRRGFFEEHGEGDPSAGTSLRPYVAASDPDDTSNFLEEDDFVGIATAPGYLDRLVPDLLVKSVQRLRVEAGEIDEATARAELLGDNYPFLLPKDVLGVEGLPTNLKIKRVRVRTKERKFRLEEDADKVKLPALEVKIDVNHTLGDWLKVSGNNLLIYLVPHLAYDEELDTTALRCFIQTNLRMDVLATLSPTGFQLGLLLSFIGTLIGKKHQLSTDLGELTGTQIPAGLFPLSRRWDALYSVTLGWILSVDEALVSGDEGEAQLRLRATTRAGRRNQPVPETVLRAGYPYDTDGSITFGPDPARTDLLFRVPGHDGLDELLPDPGPTDGGEPVDPPVGSEGNPYFVYDRDEFSLEADDPEGLQNRVYRVPLDGGSGSVRERVENDKLLAPVTLFPVCKITDETRIALLGLYSTAELEVLRERVYADEYDRLMGLEISRLATAAGKDANNLTRDEERMFRELATPLVLASNELIDFFENLTAEARDAITGYSGEERLQLTPASLADLLDARYAIFPGYTAVQQSSGEVYFRNVPNDRVSDNLGELQLCRQLFFPEEPESGD